jgi:hypothetical protein
MNARLKALFGLVVLFALGVFTGVTIAPEFNTREHASTFPIAEWTESTVADYKDRLGLNPAEEAKVREAAKRAATDILRIRGETQMNIRNTIKQMNAAIFPALNEQQRAALEQWLEEKRAAILNK